VKRSQQSNSKARSWSFPRTGRAALAALMLAVLYGSTVSSTVARPPVAVPVGSGLGSARTEADFNGDGYADLVMGSWDSANGGAVHVAYGSADGITTADPTSIEVDELPGVTGNSGVTALAAADFDGDGLSDLAIGMSDAAVDGHAEAGVVCVIHGSATGLAVSRAQRWSEATPGVKGVPESRDGFGASLAAADFGAGPEADLAIGVEGENVGRIVNAGAVVVLYGSASGLSTSESQTWTQNVPGVPGATERGDAFGSSLTGGDFDGREGADLVIGASGEDIGSIRDAGAVVVIYRAGDLLSATGSQLWSQDSAGIKGRAERGDRFGTQVSSGNFMAGSEDELVVSATGQPVEWRVGAVHVLRGSGRGLTAAGDELLLGDLTGFPGYYFGRSLAAADFGPTSPGSYDDLAVGAPGEREDGDGLGVVYVFYGSRDGMGGSQEVFWLRGGSDPHESAQFQGLGRAAVAADFGRSGAGAYADLAVSARGQEELDGVVRQAVHVLYGTRDGLTSVGRLELTASNLGIPIEGNDEDFGQPLTAGGSP
jgi:hypothetical protein